MAAGPSGEVYVAVQGQDSTFVLTYVLIRYDSDGAFAWARSYSGPSGANSYVRTVTVGADSCILITGENGSDYATVKYSPNGDLIWDRLYDSHGSGVPSNFQDAAFGIATDASNNVYVVGKAQGDSTGGDITTVKYDMSGNELWVRRYDGPIHGEDFGRDIDLDPDANVCVVGESAGDWGDDAAIVKYSSDGDTLWAVRYDGGPNWAEKAIAIEADSDGCVYAAVNSRENFGDYDIILLKYWPDGQLAWLRQYDGPAGSDDEAHALVLDGTGNPIVAGRSRSIGHGLDYLTLKYDRDGLLLWDRLADGGNTTDEAEDVAVTSDGNIAVTGFFMTPTAAQNYVTLLYDAAGTLLSLRNYDAGIESEDVALAVTALPDGCFAITGYSYEYSTLFDAATIKYCPCSCPCHADAFCDGIISDLRDVTAVIDLAFRDGVSSPTSTCSFVDADANCSGATDIIDVVLTINAAFRSADPAKVYCNWCSARL